MNLLQLPQSTLSDRRIRLEFQHSGRYKIVFIRFKFCDGCGTDKIAQYVCAGNQIWVQRFRAVQSYGFQTVSATCTINQFVCVYLFFDIVARVCKNEDVTSPPSIRAEWTASATLIARISCSVMSISSLQTIIPTGIGSCRIGNPVPKKRMY